jgi:hypothetical protein
VSRVRTALRALGRAVVQGLATENGWCWAACTLGTFPIGTALAAHGRPAPRDRTEQRR